MGRFKTISIWLAARLSIDSERGASAVEYGIMVSMIAAIVILAVIFLGSETSRTFSCTAGSLSSSVNKC
jgi:pilus assembly protein Flp/PilA